MVRRLIGFFMMERFWVIDFGKNENTGVPVARDQGRGSVRVRRSGRWMHYSLDADALDEAAGALAEVAASHRETAEIKRMCC